MEQRKRRFLGLLTATAILLVAELLCRLWLGSEAPTGKALTPDPRRLWRLASGGQQDVRVDADGFRQVKKPGPADAPLVLTVGDSSIFGHGVNDGFTIHEALGARLAERGKPARVRSLAVPGYSTMQTLEVMDELGWSLAPTVLVIGNLWSDSTLDIVRDADLYRQLRMPTARIELQLSRLALFRVVKRAVNTSRGLPAERVISWPQPGDLGVRRVPLADYARNLETLLDEARERKIGVVFLGLCAEMMVRRGRQTTDPSFVYVDAQYRVAKAHGVPYVDALKVLGGSGQDSGTLFSDDLHPNNAGSTLLGEALADELYAYGWPKRVPIPVSAPPLHAAADSRDGATRAEKSSVAGALANGNL